MPPPSPDVLRTHGNFEPTARPTMEMRPGVCAHVCVSVLCLASAMKNERPIPKPGCCRACCPKRARNTKIAKVRE